MGTETISDPNTKSSTKDQPETFLEFLKVNAFEATREFYRPLFWLKSFLLWINVRITRIFFNKLDSRKSKKF